MYFCFWSFFKSFSLFCHVVYPFSFFVMFSWLPYFTPKLFSFSCIQLLLVCFLSSHPTCFLSLFWNVLFCLYCFTFCLYLFNLPSFLSTFWFISSSCIVIFSCPNMFQHFLCLLFLTVFVVILFTFPVKFPIQSLIFCLCSLRGHQFSHKQILLLHQLLHLIQLCFLLVYMLILVFFFHFHLDCSPFYVFSGGKEVFCSFIILFKFSKFIFCSFVSVCSLLLGGCLVSKVGGSFWLNCSYFSKHSLCDTVLVSCSLFVF